MSKYITKKRILTFLGKTYNIEDILFQSLFNRECLKKIGAKNDVWKGLSSSQKYNIPQKRRQKLLK